MPIYAYKCESCGHRQDVLQKISDPVLTVCTACAAQAFVKQVTAAGFQLKGSGWYVTDFRDGGGKKAASGDAEAAPGADGAAPKPAAEASNGAAPAPEPSAAPAPATVSAPAPAPASSSAPAA